MGTEFLPTIDTIADLDNFHAEVVEKVRRTINLKKILLDQMKIDGQEEGRTAEEWEEWLGKQEDRPCKACEGTGVIKVEYREPGVVHASQAHLCVRKLYHDVIMDLRPKGYIPPKLRFIFDIGHALHATCQKAFGRALGSNFAAEVRVDNPEAMLYNGHADGEAFLPHAKVCVEIKTISELGFKGLTKPKPEHITQAMAMYAKGMDAPFVSYLYINKVTGVIKEFVLTYDEREFKRWWAKKGAPLEEALATGTPPVADATKSECGNCAYSYKEGCVSSLAITRDTLKTRSTKYAKRGIR